MVPTMEILSATTVRVPLPLVSLSVHTWMVTPEPRVAPLEPLEARLLQGWVVVVIEAVDPDHPFAAVQQRLADVIPDEPSRAGDQHFHFD